MFRPYQDDTRKGRIPADRCSLRMGTNSGHSRPIVVCRWGPLPSKAAEA